MRERVRASMRVTLGGDGAERRSVSPCYYFLILSIGSDECRCRSLPRPPIKRPKVGASRAVITYRR
eukprot:136425-Prymnesium_polylepis.1